MYFPLALASNHVLKISKRGFHQFGSLARDLTSPIVTIHMITLFFIRISNCKLYFKWPYVEGPKTHLFEYINESENYKIQKLCVKVYQYYVSRNRGQQDLCLVGVLARTRWDSSEELGT